MTSCRLLAGVAAYALAASACGPAGYVAAPEASAAPPSVAATQTGSPSVPASVLPSSTPALTTAAVTPRPTTNASVPPSAAAVTPRQIAIPAVRPTTAPPVTPPPTALPTSQVTPAPAAPAGKAGVSLFARPFRGDHPAANLFDHDVPLQFVDTNGVFVTFWGERIRVNVDGHEGYDWRMEEGTPLLAVASGQVVIAGQTTPFACPALGDRVVAGNDVYLEHRFVAPSGEAVTIRSRYSHLSRVDVRVGDQVVEGQQVGLSGNTGCSTAPHLHFEVYRLVSGRLVAVDPFGWEGSGRDPWLASPQGAESLWLWRDPPALYSEIRNPPNSPTGSGSVTITAVRWMGYRDGLNPNNEFVELTVDPRYAASGVVDLTGFTLRNNAGDTYAFPAGSRIAKDQPVVVYSGRGSDTQTALYWGRTSPAWNNLGDCARLVYPSGGVYRLTYDRCP